MTRGASPSDPRSMLRDLELFLTVALRTGAKGWAYIGGGPGRAAVMMSVYSTLTATEVTPC